MTKSPHPSSVDKGELLPCPFCGGEAQRFTLPEDGFGNGGGDVITCSGCQASSHVEFGRKENLVDRWNTRNQAHSLPGDVGMDALRKALRPFANAAKWWKAFDNQHRITTLHQHGDCLEVGHLRAALAALTPSALSGDAGEIIAARDGIEAQHGLNDTFPGDPVRVKVATARDIMIAGGVDPDGPFEVGAFPAEMRQAPPKRKGRKS